jgi:hypothetical protein
VKKCDFRLHPLSATEMKTYGSAELAGANWRGLPAVEPVLATTRSHLARDLRECKYNTSREKDT